MTLYRWVIALSTYVGILAVAAGSAPVFYLLIAACDKFFSVDWLRYLTNKPLERYVDRLRVIIGCIVVLVAVRRSPKNYRWNLHRGFRGYAGTFLFGIFVWMTLFFVIKSFVSDIEIKATPNAGVLLQAFIAGLLLATAEEVIFRGFLWDFVRNGRQTFKGISLLALIFALLHFSHCNAGSDANLFIQSFRCAWHSITDIPQRFILEIFLCVFLLSLLLCGFRMQTQPPRADYDAVCASQMRPLSRNSDFAFLGHGKAYRLLVRCNCTLLSVRLDVLANEKAGTHVSKNKVTFARQVPWERRSVFFVKTYPGRPCKRQHRV